MRFVLGYAGIPTEFYDLVRNRRDSIVLEDAEFFGIPLNAKPLGYSLAYSDAFLNHFAGRIAADHHNALAETGFAVICLDHTAESTRLFRGHLFPSVLVSTVQWAPKWGSEMVMRNSANELIAILARETEKSKRALRALRHELANHTNRTPLLLPTRNFHSDVLVPVLENLQATLSQSDDFAAQIREGKEEIQRLHPCERDDEPESFFLDAREVIYRVPGRARHAFARPSFNHPLRCVLAGKRRLGAPYDPAFHYDCTRASQTKLKGNFFGCHENARHWEGDPHLNIAPNDFVRL